MNFFAKTHADALEALKARGFPIPPALANASDPRPLAISTRSDIAAYVEAHGGGEEEARILGQAMAALTRTPFYIEALAADLSERVSILTGAAVGPVSELDRHSAALQIHAKAVRSNKPAGVPDAAPTRPKPPPQPSKPPAPPPPAAQKPASTPFRNGGQLSAAEVERRKRALAALTPTK